MIKTKYFEATNNTALDALTDALQQVNTFVKSEKIANLDILEYHTDSRKKEGTSKYCCRVTLSWFAKED